ncbi:hypothetical protein [Streptomyces sp. NPDC090053]|uniref:hypothetical protein n=1 Tax=Streptomyces sp. NPDC090053 TaxID=3365932 RepID=UPI003817B990
MECALRIDSDNTTAKVVLPDGDPSAQRSVLREQIGGSPEGAVYHRRALLHVHGDGRNAGLAPNLAGWALACVWRGRELPYQLCGPVVVTGPYADEGGVAPLEEGLLRQAEVTAQTVRETLAAWKHRPPVSNEAAVQELLAYVRHEMTSV